MQEIHTDIANETRDKQDENDMPRASDPKVILGLKLPFFRGPGRKGGSEQRLSGEAQKFRLAENNAEVVYHSLSKEKTLQIHFSTSNDMFGANPVRKPV